MESAIWGNASPDIHRTDRSGVCYYYVFTSNLLQINTFVGYNKKEILEK